MPERFVGMIVPVAQRISIPEHMLDEAYSEGLVLVVDLYHKFDPSKGPTLPQYMWNMLGFRLRDWYRREGYRGEGCRPMPAYFDVAKHDRPEERHGGGLEEVLEASRALPERERLALLGAAWGATHWELSRALKASGKQVAALQQNARQQLRQQLHLL